MDVIFEHYEGLGAPQNCSFRINGTVSVVYGDENVEGKRS
jgi:hypothetical protein